MESIDRRFDAVVIGSGPGGSMAVKEPPSAGWTSCSSRPVGT